MTIHPLIVVTLVTGSVLSVAAQTAQTPVAENAAPAKVEERVNVDRLPLDLQRLERQLRQSVERENWDGFRLRYSVEVFGTAPRIQFFDPKEVLPGGPIPYGAPTHKEMIETMTPKEYRAPAMDLSALRRWLEEKLK